MAIASLVLGIVSLFFSLFFFFPVLPIIGGIVGIVGIVLGIYGKKDGNKVGLAQAGLICSIVGTALCFTFYLACAACIV